MPPRFRLGRLYATPGAVNLLEQLNVSPLVLLARHASGDWGDLGVSDRDANEQAVADGGRLLSAYTLADRARVWVITEAADEAGERACTTVLLPEEY